MPEARPELIGYVDRLSVAPGDRVRVMVSSEFPRYRASVVRMIQGDTNPAGPGPKEEPVATTLDGEYEGRRQATHPGSYVQVTSHPSLSEPASFTLQAWIRPTRPAAGVQGIMGCRVPGRDEGYGLYLDESGALGLRVGAATVTTGTPLRPSVWYFVAATHDADTGAVRVESRLVDAWPVPDARGLAEGAVSASPAAAGAPFLVGAGAPIDVADRAGIVEGFNGRIDSPRVFGRALSPAELDRLADGAAATAVAAEAVAAWDLAAGIGSSRVADASGNGHDGSAVNHPTRGVAGVRWDGSAFHWKDAPEHYAAIHFHDDDLDDCRWDVSHEFDVPEDARSGFYAVRLEASGWEDHIPFFVRPPRGRRTAPIAFLVPTHTYLAYANESVLLRDDVDFSTMTNVDIQADPYDLFLKGHPQLGASLYDLHSDGSGWEYSTALRPIVSMRPRHRHWVTGAPRHYATDLYFVDWLEEKGLRYDVVTDGDLTAEGADLLRGYDVVVTGSHPEYWTAPARAGLEAYLDGGGSLMYLGGNGFYWVIGADPEMPDVIEVRRGLAGSRCWESHPGELHLASTGELGGLWRHRGRAPNALVGIGFAGQGWDVKSPGFRRLPDSYDERAAFVFEGVQADVIGEYGLILNAAAGEEVDRMDVALGTPPHALRLATSEGMHSDYYLVCHEDQLVTMGEIHGTDNPNMRADVVYFEHRGGGGVFSVGSMTWMGSLSHNGYDNDISRVTENVLRRFCSD